MRTGATVISPSSSRYTPERIRELNREHRGIDTPTDVLAFPVDGAFDELGHLLTYPLPYFLTAVAGSFFQVAVPFGLAVYFFGFQQDLAASGVLPRVGRERPRSTLRATSPTHRTNVSSSSAATTTGRSR